MLFELFDRSPQAKRIRMSLSLPSTEEQLQELRDELATSVSKFPERQLWYILRKSEVALKKADDDRTISLLKDIRQSANWEVQSRNRAT